MAIASPAVVLWLAAQQAAPDSVLRLVDVPGLARLDTDVRCRQFASTDPTWKGDDHGHFLALEGKRAVLAEMEGPGVIARIWTANAAGRLKVYFDGESEPRIDCPFQDVFTGKYAPFVEPIATRQGGGWISYFPIPYKKHCRVEVDELEDPRALWYQVQYLTYPRNTRIRTFKRDLEGDERWYLRKVLELWKSPPIEPPRGDAAAVVKMDEVRQLFYYEPPAGGRFESAGGFKVEPRATVETFAQRTGPGAIRYLGLHVERANAKLLRGLVLEITADGTPEPSVSVPAADLFGVAFGPTPWRGLVAGYTEQRGGYLRLPIPWQRGISISWRNTTDEPIVAMQTVHWLDAVAADPEAGTLHAEFRAEDQVGEPLYELARVDGPGKFVGVNLALQGVGDLWYLEGNEQFFVDNEPRPSIVGTGTEDFFNGGFYWDTGPLALPLHGVGLKEEWTTNRTTPWRHLLPDAVSFKRGLVARLEHGSANAVRDAYYSGVAFWYSDEPWPVRRVQAEEARLPRQWVKRPKGALAAASLEWSPEDAMEPAKWEELSSEYRGCEYSLFQEFPVSRFEREKPKVAGELAQLRGRVARAKFTVDEADRYRMSLLLATHRGASSVRVFVDDRAVGELFPPESDGVAPWMAPDLGPIGLTKGEHELELRLDPAEGEPWLGLDCIAFESAAPFVRSWWVSPPVECDPSATVEQAPPAQAAFLARGFDPAGAGWKEVEGDGDALDLNLHVTNRAPILGYAMTWVFAPEARVARARLGSDDGVQAWCNGDLVWTNALHRPLALDEDRFDLPLERGWNALVVKVRNDGGGYALALRLADPEGTLKTALRPDPE